MFCSSTVERQGKYYRTPKEKVSLGLLFRGLMKEIIDRSSFATVRALLEGVPNLHHKPTTAPSGAKRLTRHSGTARSIAARSQWTSQATITPQRSPQIIGSEKFLCEPQELGVVNHKKKRAHLFHIRLYLIGSAKRTTRTQRHLQDD